MKYQCTFCAKVHGSAWRCRSCGMLTCDACSKGGKSSALGIAGRAAAGYMTMGLSELARMGYRKANQECPGCGGDSLIRV